MRPVRGRRPGLPAKVRPAGSAAGASSRWARCGPGPRAWRRRVRTHIRADGQDVSQSSLGQRGSQVGVGAVGGVGHHDRWCHAPGGEGVEHVQGQAPLLAVHDLGRDAGHGSAAGVQGPLLRQEQAPLQRAGGRVARGVDADRDLAVGPFAQGPAVLRATATDILPSLGTDTSSITQAVGRMSGSIRSAIRRCTGTGSHVDWFTNCCRFCSLPSGSRDAIAWMDLRRPSSISPRK